MSTLSDPSGEVAAVTPSDTVALRKPRSLFVGGAGNLTVKNNAAGGTVAFNGLVAGQFLPIRPEFVMATGTTATGIVALY